MSKQKLIHFNPIGVKRFKTIASDHFNWDISGDKHYRTVFYEMIKHHFEGHRFYLKYLHSDDEAVYFGFEIFNKEGKKTLKPLTCFYMDLAVSSSLRHLQNPGCIFEYCINLIFAYYGISVHAHRNNFIRLYLSRNDHTHIVKRLQDAGVKCKQTDLFHIRLGMFWFIESAMRNADIVAGVNMTAFDGVPNMIYNRGGYLVLGT